MRLRTILASLAAGILITALAGCTPLDAQGSAAASVPHVSDAGRLGPQDGYIPTGGSVALTDDVPAVTRLDGRLRDALGRAAAAAAERHVAFTIADGWRSTRYQQYLFDQAVAQYGSAQEASRWVKPADQSKHVHGAAVDIATADAMDWLVRFGAEYGLCQIYANESWHFELAADASGTCPALLTDGSAG
ncbi:M15 family metallopeptidase [Leifsonia sp. NPDC058248]|uniref:M15 family metallopeptidase n=1 Tax=Leifsonia sp. NPDC058248 TaxID=3346402 RepID=UPI0036DA159E